MNKRRYLKSILASSLLLLVGAGVLSCSSSGQAEGAPEPICDADFGRACSATAGCPSFYACYAKPGVTEGNCALRCDDALCPDGLTCDPMLQVCLACSADYEPQRLPDDCSRCTSSAECGSKFCNQISHSDWSELFDEPQPTTGRCSAPSDGACCATGVLSGTSLCIGTGCPPGEFVDICDRFSGQEVQ